MQNTSDLSYAGAEMLSFTEKGLFCPSGGFYIDPRRSVEIALITHAHTDHARRGSGTYYCATPCKELLAVQLGRDKRIVPMPYGVQFRLGDALVSFHPAGHILGSSQVRIEKDGEVWVVSGDFKREHDPTCDPFELVPCDTFVTEATFGKPRYRWGDTSGVGLEIYNWWKANSTRGINSVLFCYALGKAQRVLAELASHTKEPILVFGKTAEFTECYRRQGILLPPTLALEETDPHRKFHGDLIVAPHSIMQTEWMERLNNPDTSFVSGWMANRGGGFTLSDHADWPSLLQTATTTGARRVLIIDDRGETFARHLRKLGVDASVFRPGQKPRPYLPVQGELFTENLSLK